MPQWFYDALMVEVEQIHHIADGGRIDRDIKSPRIWEVVPAPLSDRFKAPVRFDEPERRGVTRIAMRDVAAFAVWRHDDHGGAGAVAEEVKRLDVARVPIGWLTSEQLL